MKDCPLFYHLGNLRFLVMRHHLPNLFFKLLLLLTIFSFFPYLLTFQIHDLSLRILALIQFVLLLLTYIYYRFTYSVLNQWHWFVSVQLKKKRFVLNSFSYSFHNMGIKQWKVKKIKQKRHCWELVSKALWYKSLPRIFLLR